MNSKKIQIISYLLFFIIITFTFNNNSLITKQTLKEKISGPESVIFSPSGSCLAVVNRYNHNIAIFTIDKNTNKINLTPVSILNEDEKSNIVLSGFSSNDKYLAIANQNNSELIIYEFDSQYSVISKNIFKNLFVEPVSLTFSLDGKFLAIGDAADNSVKIYLFNQNTGEVESLVSDISNDISSPESLSFSYDGKLIAISSYDNDLIKILSFDGNTAKDLINIKTAQHPFCVKFSPSGNLAAACKNVDKDNKVILYKLDRKNLKAKELNKIGINDGIKELHDISFSSDGTYFAVAHDDTVRLYNIDTKGRIKKNYLTSLTSFFPIDIDFNSKNNSLAVANLNSNEINVFALGIGLDFDDKLLNSVKKSKITRSGFGNNLQNNGPIASIKPPSLVVKEGNKIKLIGMATGGTPPFIYEWKGPNKNVISGQIVTIQNSKLSDSGVYTLKIIDAQKNVSSAKALVKVIALNQVEQINEEQEVSINNETGLDIISEQSNHVINLAPNIQESIAINNINNEFIETAPVHSEKQEIIVTEKPPFYNENCHQLCSTDNIFNDKISFDEKDYIHDDIDETPTCHSSPFMYEPGFGKPETQTNAIINKQQFEKIDANIIKNETSHVGDLVPTNFNEINTKTLDKDSLASLLDNFHNLVDNNIELVVKSSASAVYHGRSISFTAEAIGGQEPYSFEWSGPNGFHCVTKTATIPGMGFSNVGTYSIIVTDANNSTKVAHISLTVGMRSEISKAISKKYCNGTVSRLFFVNQVALETVPQPIKAENVSK